MSMSGALSNAISGLSAAKRSADLVATNIANASTGGYGRREIELAAGGNGGVQVATITRVMDRAALADRRDADAAVAMADTRNTALTRIADAIGEPGSGASLHDSLVNLETSLLSAAEYPESEPRLASAVDAAKRLATRLGEISDTVQIQRARADREIARTISQLNADLASVAELNIDIQRAMIAGDPSPALIDERQKIIDRISQAVPVRELDRGNGKVALMSDGGLLLDGGASELTFVPATVVTSDLDIASGTLSGVELDGVPVDMARERSALSGGSLQGLFSVRDGLGPGIQADLDAVARDLMERFADPAIDPTLAPGAPGLFTDAGGPFIAADERGLADRLEVNAALDPDLGGSAWRLRDGIGAAAPGSVGDARGLQRLGEALSSLRPPSSGSFGPVPRDAATLAGDLLSGIGAARVAAEADRTYAATRADSLNREILAEGVDTDAEMQKLLLIEQAYAANARVVSTVQSMLDTLMEI